MTIHIATKIFTADDQARFARLSGDYNPMHMDPVAARRTQAGVPVVHGLHTLAWFLDEAARHANGRSLAGSLKVRFDKCVAVGEQARAIVTKLDETSLRGEVCVGTSVVARIAIESRPAAGEPARPTAPVIHTDTPLDLTLEEMGGRSGVLVPPVALATLADAFPAAAAALAPHRLSSLISLTYLVGMVCPGLHSIFGGLTLAAAAGGEDASVGFEVTSTDPRFRMVKAAIRGGGWTGTVDSFARHPPTAQEGIAGLRRHVQQGEFEGTRALIIGGSRGLGELIAKVIAAGGGDVGISYARGEADATRVAHEIVESGGSASVIHYDVEQPAAEQLSCLSGQPTSLYYMATPPIFRRKSGVFDSGRFDEFFAYYVTGFWNLCETLRERSPQLSVFYPSSVAVETRPADMTEYAMAKIAGEFLCADAAASSASLRILTHRLPRLATDQTATLQHVQTPDSLETILPLVRAVEHPPAQLDKVA